MEGMLNDKARFGVINNAIFSNMIITSGFQGLTLHST